MVKDLNNGYVVSEVHKGIATIEFYHPQSNSLPHSILTDLANEIHALGSENSVKVIVLRSGGEKTFCAGASFDELQQIENEKKGFTFFSGFANVINAMRKCPKLIIGRIHGKCVGGGVGLAAAVDYAIAVEGAEIKLSELAVGIGPLLLDLLFSARLDFPLFLNFLLMPLCGAMPTGQEERVCILNYIQQLKAWRNPSFAYQLN